MVLGRVIDHALAIEIREHVGDHENGVRGFAVHGLEHPVEVVGRAHAKCLHRRPERVRCARGSLVTLRHAKIVPVPQHRNPLQFRAR